MQSQCLSSHAWTSRGPWTDWRRSWETGSHRPPSLPVAAVLQPRMSAGLYAFRGHPNCVSFLLLPLLQVMCSVCYIASPSSMTVRSTTWAAAERKPS